MNVKTITVGIQVSESFIQKLTRAKGTPEHNEAQRTLFEEMQRVERDIKKQLDAVVRDYQDRNLQWDGEA